MPSEQVLAVRDDEEAQFCKCGTELEWAQCTECGGEGGWFAYERDYDPLWDDPDGWIACELCRGEGRWLECPNAERHQKAQEDEARDEMNRMLAEEEEYRAR